MIKMLSESLSSPVGGGKAYMAAGDSSTCSSGFPSPATAAGGDHGRVWGGPRTEGQEGGGPAEVQVRGPP